MMNIDEQKKQKTFSHFYFIMDDNTGVAWPPSVRDRESFGWVHRKRTQSLLCNSKFII